MGIDPDDALDRVDCRNSVCPASFCRFSRRAHLRNIRCQLGQDRNLCSASGRGSKPLHQFRYLPDIRAKATLCHIGAGKVQFNGIRTVFFAVSGQFLPLRIILSHDGSEYELRREIGFQPPEDLHVLRHAVVRKLLDVLKSDDAAVISRDCREAGRGFMDLKRADGLKRSSCPPRLKGPGAHIIGTGNHRGGEKERILQRDPAELCLQEILIFRQLCFQFRPYFLMQAPDQVFDRYLSGTDTGSLARSTAVQARIFLRQHRCRRLLVVEPDTPQEIGWFQIGTCLVTGCVAAQGTGYHVGTIEFLVEHVQFLPPFS